MPEIFDKFTSHYKNAILSAARIAKSLRNGTIGTLHLIAGVAETPGSLGYEILLRSQVKKEKIQKLMAQLPPEKKKKEITSALSELSQKIIVRSVIIAGDKQSRYVGTEHLLTAILFTDEAAVKDLCEKLHGDFERFKSQISAILKSSAKFQEVAIAFDTGTAADTWAEHMLGTKFGKTSILETFGTDLTSPEQIKKIDEVIGRDEEIDRMIHILNRRYKNNPLLVGDPGVGKTALVEGLARRISEGVVPFRLAEKHVWKIDLAAMLSGTMYRGEYEARVKQLMDEVKRNENIILFIDEIHNIIGSGSASGSLDTANMLKPALSRGEMRLIGATTFQEYKKHIGGDAAFDRRMQIIFVKEPNASRTEDILRGIKKYYEEFHKVKIHDDAVKSAVLLSERYLQERFFPDKAIDLIDEASAHERLKISTPEELKLERDMENLLHDIIELKEKAVMKEAFSEARELQKKQEELEKKLEKLAEYIVQKSEKTTGEIKAIDIKRVVSRLTGIPIENVEGEERKKLQELPKTLGRKIIGQETAIEKLSRVVQRGRLGIHNPKRPMGSLLLVGPSGVGKTECAKIVAQLLFDRPEALIRIDMSELAEKFNISKLIGAPAGYVGYKETNTLADSVRKNPYSVVLFDEIEKAHPDAHSLLLQILEDGRLVDASGNIINFKNTIIIVTSNVGQHLYRDHAKIGFQEQKNAKHSPFPHVREDLLKELEKKFRPEFLNRFDEIVPFEPLTLEHIEKIVQLQLNELTERLEPLGIHIETSNDIVKFLANKSENPLYGARLVRKNIQEMVENRISEALLASAKKLKKQTFSLNAKNEEIVVERCSQQSAVN
jgi:ATP-dependent Clp protease ATP-binding subunit ClpC